MDRLLLKIFFQVFSLVQLMTSPFKASNNGAKIGLNNGHLSKKCIRFFFLCFTERTVRIYTYVILTEFVPINLDYIYVPVTILDLTIPFLTSGLDLRGSFQTEWRSPIAR